MYMEEYDSAVDDILNQLSNQNHSVTKEKQALEIPDVDELEEYLVKRTAKLIDKHLMLLIMLKITSHLHQRIETLHHSLSLCDLQIVLLRQCRRYMLIKRIS